MSAIVAAGRGYLRRVSTTFTFTGAAGFGAIGNCTVFTVTGEVLVLFLVPTCTVNVGVDGGTGAASISIGVTNSTTLFLAATVATAIDANELWINTTPDANGLAVPATMINIAITQDVLFAVTSTGTQLVNAGAVRTDLYYLPLSSDGLVV